MRAELTSSLGSFRWAHLTDGVRWEELPLFSFRRSRAFVEDMYGPPTRRDLESNGMGPYDAWAIRFTCDLEVLLLAFHFDPSGAVLPAVETTWVEVQSNSRDFAHITAHLSVPIEEISPWLPDRRLSISARWVVWRQDDNGCRFEVSACSSRCEAELVAAKFESAGHKQTYWVEERTRPES